MGLLKKRKKRAEADWENTRVEHLLDHSTVTVRGRNSSMNKTVEFMLNKNEKYCISSLGRPLNRAKFLAVPEISSLWFYSQS